MLIPDLLWEHRADLGKATERSAIIAFLSVLIFELFGLTLVLHWACLSLQRFYNYFLTLFKKIKTDGLKHHELAVKHFRY